MVKIEEMPRIKDFRFPPSMICYAVWDYHRFELSLRDVEDLLAERGVTVSYETIRDWVARFGTQISAKFCGGRLTPSGKWHLDEVATRSVARITGSGGPWTDTVTFSTSRCKAVAMRGLPISSSENCSNGGASLHAHHGQAWLIRRREIADRASHPTPLEQGPQQSHRGLAPTHATTRKDHEPVQVAGSGTTGFVGPRSNCHPISPQTPPSFRGILPPNTSRRFRKLGRPCT